MARGRKSNPLAVIILVVILMAASSFLTFKAVFNCDHCGKISFGPGYAPNTLTDIFTDEQRICKTCAEEEHDSILSKDLDSYKLTIDWFTLNKNVDDETTEAAK